MDRASLRTALVTGGNRGLGLETGRQLAAAGLRVFLTSRAEDGAARALQKQGLEVSSLGLDVTAPESVASLAAHLDREGIVLDVLVNNAGISMKGFDADVARGTLAVNFFGAMRVTDALLPRLRDGGNIVMVSSGMGELSSVSPALREKLLDSSLSRETLVELMESFVQDVALGRHAAAGWPSSAYRVSKVGLNALTRILARELSSRRIRVNAVCPGWVRTDMGGRSASRGVEEGARSIVWATAPEGPTGGFFRDGRPIAW